MSDLIERQAAIDALEREKTYCTAYKDGYTQTDYFKQYNMGLTDGIKALNKLSSAQAEPHWNVIHKRPMTEDERAEWSERLGYDIEYEDAFIYSNLPDDLAEVNITWVNHDPEPYYDFTKDKPASGSAVYYKGAWYWYSSTCVDILAECGRNEMDKIDDAVEVTAWMPLPEPLKEEPK